MPWLTKLDVIFFLSAIFGFIIYMVIALFNNHNKKENNMMPDKIYLNKYMLRKGMLYPAQPPADVPEKEYIRKDIVDETVKTAEDHAYFAGQEKLREKMLEWLQKEYDENKWFYDVHGKPNNLHIGRCEAYKQVIDKLESL